MAGIEDFGMSRRQPPTGARLIWKLEQPSGGQPSDDDLGPAWIAPGRSGLLPSGPLSRGEWLTRREARAIAEEHGLTFFEDDGSKDVLVSGSSGIDVRSVNEQLERVGVPKSELRLEVTPGFDDVLVHGSRLQELPGLERDPGSPIRTAMISMSLEEALAALDLLVPGWRPGGR
jgi:hypothetical protein